MDEVPQIYIIIISTLICSAFFSGMEIAFVTSNKLKIELDKKQGLFSGKIFSIYENERGTLRIVIYRIVLQTAFRGH